MAREKMDCKKPEPDPADVRQGDRCRWCGRPIGYRSIDRSRSGYFHKRGYVRTHPDPRKANASVPTQAG
jgi:ribosomal protein S14